MMTGDARDHGSFEELVPASGVTVGEDRVRIVTDMLDVGVWEHDPQTGIVVCNARFRALFGFGADEAVSLESIFDGIHIDDRERARAYIADALQGAPADPHAELRMVDARRGDRWIACRARAFFERGTAFRLLGTIEDITEPKRKAITAERRYELTEALMDARTPEHVEDIAFAHAYRIFGDASFGALFRTSHDRTEIALVRGVSVGHYGAMWQHIPLDLDVPLTVAMKTKTPMYCETVASFAKLYPHAASSLFANVAARAAIPVVADGHSRIGILIGFREARTFSADEKRLLAEIARQAGRALERAHAFQMESDARRVAETANRAKDDFLATVSHELRTPVASILGWARMLAAGRVPPARQRGVFETIERNAQAEVRLLEDLLDLARIEAGRMRLEVQQVHLSQVVQRALETMRPLADAKDVMMAAAIDSSVCPIAADASRLEQIALNLLSNAIKFTPAGGSVSVTLRQEPTHLVLSVADTGKGIDPEFIPLLFERFRQAELGGDRAHAGLGLGLAISRELVEEHGGTIEAHSDGPGQGATFRVRFPRESEPKR